ncbi:MAG TPA: glycosyltransferase [Desulfuromonadales bacterium]|nr:glycosyltransferase [Desulfuromonadales bacterium]
MSSPTVDIIVPVWNSPFETRACLAAILEHSPEARLIIVDNGSNRETELMLEEFSEPLGERGLFITTERNIGLIPAINRGLARSDSDIAVIVRPHVIVTSGWLPALLNAAMTTGTGIISPHFSGVSAPVLPTLVCGCSLMESCTVSSAALLLRGEMRMVAGFFDEGLDGGEWCLRDYVRRVAGFGYRTCLLSRPVLVCGTEQSFGSTERQRKMNLKSQSVYRERWGQTYHFAVYFGKEARADSLSDSVDAILEAARLGNRFALLLHRRQYADFCRRGWHALHTGIEICRLSPIFSLRSLSQRMATLQSGSPGLVMLRGGQGASFPGHESAQPLTELSTILSDGLVIPRPATEEKP